MLSFNAINIFMLLVAIFKESPDRDISPSNIRNNHNKEKMIDKKVYQQLELYQYSMYESIITVTDGYYFQITCKYDTSKTLNFAIPDLESRIKVQCS